MKEVKETDIFNSWWKFILMNLSLAFIVVFYFCPGCFFSLSGIKEIFRDFIFAFLISSALSYGGNRIEVFFDGKISWIQAPVRRLILTYVLYLIYVFIISLILVFLFRMLFIDGASFQNTSFSLLVSFTKIPIIVASFVIAVFIARSWLMEWKKSAIEAEQLRNEGIKGQYQSLKDQLNPHFLFNSLNVLSNLVYEDADKSVKFIQQLSKIYRYVLDVHQDELVPLKMELAFAENYLSLQKIRFEDSLNFKMEIEIGEGHFLPPLSLQLLLENAIKHNIVSRDKPLEILISHLGDRLEVKNNLQLKNKPSNETSGIGLDNIQKRYNILSAKNIEIQKTQDYFTVILPLLKIGKG